MTEWSIFVDHMFLVFVLYNVYTDRYSTHIRSIDTIVCTGKWLVIVGTQTNGRCKFSVHPFTYETTQMGQNYGWSERKDG